MRRMRRVLGVVVVSLSAAAMFCWPTAASALRVSVTCGWVGDCYICNGESDNCTAVSWSCTNGDSGSWMMCD